MATFTKAQVATRVANRISNLPSTLTDNSNAIIQDFVDEASFEIENESGVSIDTTTVSESTLPVLLYKTCMLAIAFTLEDSYSIGKFALKKNLNANMKMYQELYSRAIKNLTKGQVDFTE